MSPLLHTNEQSFVPDMLEQIKSLVLDHMSDVLINHCKDKQIDWKPIIDLQRLVNAMSFACPNHLDCRARSRNFDQFNSFAKHSMLTAANPTLHISSLSVHPISALPNLDLQVLNNLTLDRPDCPPDSQDESHLVHSAAIAEQGGNAKPI